MCPKQKVVIGCPPKFVVTRVRIRSAQSNFEQCVSNLSLSNTIPGKSDICPSVSQTQLVQFETVARNECNQKEICQLNWPIKNDDRCLWNYTLAISYQCYPALIQEVLICSTSYMELDCRSVYNEAVYIFNASLTLLSTASNQALCPFIATEFTSCDNGDVTRSASKKCNFKEICDLSPEMFTASTRKNIAHVNLSCRKRNLQLVYACVHPDVMSVNSSDLLWSTSKWGDSFTEPPLNVHSPYIPRNKGTHLINVKRINPSTIRPYLSNNKLILFVSLTVLSILFFLSILSFSLYLAYTRCYYRPTCLCAPNAHLDPGPTGHSRDCYSHTDSIRSSAPGHNISSSSPALHRKPSKISMRLMSTEDVNYATPNNTFHNSYNRIPKHLRLNPVGSTFNRDDTSGYFIRPANIESNNCGCMNSHSNFPSQINANDNLYTSSDPPISLANISTTPTCCYTKEIGICACNNNFSSDPHMEISTYVNV